MALTGRDSSGRGKPTPLQQGQLHSHNELGSHGADILSGKEGIINSRPAPTPLLEETKRRRDLGPRAGAIITSPPERLLAPTMDEAPTFMLPAIGIDQLPT